MQSLPETILSGDTLQLNALVRPQITASADAQAFAAIQFYSDAAGTVSLGNRYETNRIDAQSALSLPYAPVFLDIIVPDNAASFKVMGVVTVPGETTSTYYAGFDSFSLMQIPEPHTAALAALALLGLAGRRRPTH